MLHRLEKSIIYSPLYINNKVKISFSQSQSFFFLTKVNYNFLIGRISPLKNNMSKLIHDIFVLGTS